MQAEGILYPARENLYRLGGLDGKAAQIGCTLAKPRNQYA